MEISSGWGEGSDEVALLPEKDANRSSQSSTPRGNGRSTRFEAGFGWITGPAELGGRALPRSYQRLYDGIESPIRDAAARPSTGSVSGWSLRRSSPTPPSR